MELDAFGVGYLRLTLEIHKHIDGYVDAYFGPAEIKAEVEAAPRKTPAALLDNLARLRDALPDGDSLRREYLEAVLRAMDCTLRGLNGETFDYLDEVYRLYDIRPALVGSEVFEQAAADLDAVLPGSGPLTERLEAWRTPFNVPTDKLMDALELTRREVRERTLTLVDLVPGESIEAALTKDQPWSAYNWFKGNAHSLIEFNTDIPVSALDLAALFAHEGYPGHHTEHQLKEQRLYRERGHGEVASALLHSPSAVIAEGIATTAAEIIFPGGTHHAWTAEVLLPAAGLPGIDPDLLRQVSEAREVLRKAHCNGAILYHTGQLTEAQTVEYYETYGLASPQRARIMFRFVSNPLFRSYVFTYTEGHRLIEEAARGGDKAPLFKRLLVEEMLPSRLGIL